jgi:hypothetical protein
MPFDESLSTGLDLYFSPFDDSAENKIFKKHF